MKAQVISFHCVLKTKLGRLISKTVNRDVVTMPLPGQAPLLSGLVEGLQNLKGGEKRSISVSADRAYGFYDPAKVITCPREAVEVGRLVVGDNVRADYEGQPTLFRVTSVNSDEVTLDANHPLAGEDLVFEIEALNVREAGPEDLQPADLDLH
ncbi:MAG: FKBP-type peptidyl-prolyl cis-trans isomerase [Bdellovibrionales bacterium]|nr:FKBP-type peptidyl-prolyl cis-trans isomerase [Bdellovibrionales bacterium]